MKMVQNNREMDVDSPDGLVDSSHWRHKMWCSQLATRLLASARGSWSVLVENQAVRKEGPVEIMLSRR